jgi:hypothetical protein
MAREKTDHKSKEISPKGKRILGALAVVVAFATFLFKDELRDNYKDLASSIEAAQNAYNVERTSALTLKFLRSSALQTWAATERAGSQHRSSFEKGESMIVSVLQSTGNQRQNVE